MASSEPDPSTDLVFHGKRIREDIYGFICLDDLWALAQAPESKRPKHWRNKGSFRRLQVELAKKVTKSNLNGETPFNTTIYANRGRAGGGTFCHPVLALAYAEYLDANLGIEVREVFLRFRAADATLADQILQRASAEANRWVGMRAMGRAQRLAFTDVLQAHQVTPPGYAACTDEVYTKLFDRRAKQMKVDRAVGSKPLRDSMTTDELSYIAASEALASERIEAENRRGNRDCAEATGRSARFIREAIERDRQDRRKPDQLI